MVKKIVSLLIPLGLFFSTGHAFTVANDTLMSQVMSRVTVGDSNLTIGGSATITMDVSGVLRLVDIGAGARIRFYNSGVSLTAGGIRNGGRIDTLGASDSILVYNRDLVAADSDFVCWGAGSMIVSGNASRTARIIGVSVAGVKPAFYYRSTSSNFKLSGCTVSGFYKDFGSGYKGGFNLFPTTNRTVAARDVYFSGVTFDSAAVHIGRTQTLRGFRMDNCTFNLSNTDGYIRTVSPCDTFYRVQINHQHNGAAPSGYGILVDAGADSTYIYGCHIDPLGGSGENTLDRGIQINAARVKMERDTVHGCRFNVVTTSSNSHAGQLLSSVLYGASHEQLHWESAASDSNWIVYGNLIYGGGARSLVTVYKAGASTMKNLKFWYNTVVSTGGGKSAFGWDCPAGTGCASTATGLSFVGNIFAGANPSHSSADMLVDGYTLTFTDFKKNVIDRFDTTRLGNGGDIVLPYVISDSNTISSAFGFVDSGASDYRLSGSAPILNCGDTLYGDTVFGTSQHDKIPYDPGYYQSYTTGTCGGGSPTPTGACCYNYTCAVVTEAQCTALSGVYQGDGTTTCADCTPPSSTIGTGYGKRSWMTLATLNYGGDPYNLAIHAPLVAREFDLLVNPGGTFETTVTTADSAIGKLSYITLSSYIIGSTDTADLRTFCASRGYTFDSCFISASGATACINAIAPNGTPCTGVGGNMCSVHGSKIAFCGWNTYRLTPNFRYVGTQQFAIYKTLRDAKNKGVMQDEACYVWQDTLTHSGSNSPWFPYPGYWSSGSAAQTNAWTGSGLTNTQIADSLIHLKRSGWLSELMDSLNAHGQQIYSNGAAYGRMGSDLAGDVAILGAGMLFGEGMDISFTDAQGGFYPTQAWTFMDSLRAGGRNWQNGRGIIWTHINAADTVSLTATDGAADMKRRLCQERYAWYMMAQTPLRSFLFIATNWGGAAHVNGWSQATDSLFKFVKSMDAPLGAPSGVRSVLTTGTDPAGQTYTVYQRNYANGKVLWRGVNGSNYGSGSAATVALGANYYPVNYDGTYATQASTASIRNGEGLIFLTSTASTGDMTISDATVTEGGDMVFTVTLSAAQSGGTSFNYVTANGTATSGTDYTAQSGSKSIPAGELATTISVPTTNRANCQASRAFTLTISSVIPSTVTITDPTGTGTIADDDCGVTYGKTYKGKIVIKGKVKP